MAEKKAEEKGNELVAQAQKKAGKTGWFSGPNYEEVAELYTQAANNFKAAKKWERSGETYVLAAENYIKAKAQNIANLSYLNAAGVYRKVSLAEAEKYYKKATEYYLQQGNFVAAAKQHKEIAEMLEKDMEYDAAMDNYLRAGEYYESDGKNALYAANCLEKAAQFAALSENYDKGIELFEKIAHQSGMGSLSTARKVKIRDYYMSAILCYLAKGDAITASKSLEKFEQWTPGFSKDVEYTYMKKLIKAVQAVDFDAFNKALKEYERSVSMDQTKNNLLVRIKETLQNPGGSLA